MQQSPVSLPGDDFLDRQFEELADSLATRSYAVMDDFLSLSEVESLRNRLSAIEAQGDFKKAGIGQQDEFLVDGSIRGDYIRWIEPGEAADPTQVFLDRARRLMTYLNRTCYLGLQDFEAHFTVYPPGTFYKRHLDQFRHDDHRRLSVICYLNPHWQPGDGGQLRLFLPGEQGEEVVDIAPLGGRLACFLSDRLEHEVLLCYQPRYSLTGWMLDRPLDLTFL